MRTFALLGILAFAGIGTAVFVAQSFERAPRQAEAVPQQPAYSLVKVACACATDYASIGAMLRAYRNQDVAALSGLIARRKAIQIDAGTRVLVVGIDNGVSSVVVQSG